MFHPVPAWSLVRFAVCAMFVLAACGAPSIDARLQEAQLMLQERRFEEAIPLLRTVLDEEPDLARANYMLGVALHQTQQPSLAVWPLEKALADSQYALTAGLLLGSIHNGFGAHDDAVRVASRIIEVVPDGAAAYRLRAEAQMNNRRLEEALEDAKHFAELQPDDPMSYVLQAAVLSDLKRYDEAKQIFRQAVDATKDDPDRHQRALAVLAQFVTENLEDDEEGEQIYKEALELHPESQLLRGAYLSFLASRSRAEEGETVLREAIDREPENFGLRTALAANLKAQDRVDESLELLEAAAAEFRSPAAWDVLGRALMAEEKYAEAETAVQKAVDMVPGEESLRFLLAETAVLAGHYDRARELATAFESRPRAAFVEGMIALRTDDHEQALASFQQGLREWPDNIGARFNSGIAAQRLGDWDRAISEYREAARLELTRGKKDGQAFETDAILLLAEILYRRGDYSGALSWARKYKDQYKPEAALVAAKSRGQLGQADGARSQLEELLESSAGEEARAQLVELEIAAGNGDRARALALEADPGSRWSLRSYSLVMNEHVEAGDAAGALGFLDAVAAKSPESADLVALRGNVLYAAGRTPEAEKEFDRALELQSDHAMALSSLATLRGAAADFEGAIELFAKAAEAEPDNGEHAYHAGQIALHLQRRDEAERWLSTAVTKDPGHAASRNDLAWLLSQQESQLDRALDLASEAYKLNSGPNFADTLGWIHFQRGEYDQAVDLLERAVGEAPDAPSLRYHLGMALKLRGEKERAARELRQAVEMGDFPEHGSAAEELRELEGARS